MRLSNFFFVTTSITRAAEGFTYALGAWVLEGSDAVGGSATALASPGLFGTWPIVDFSRGYACLFFTKSFLAEQKADAYMEAKKEVDKAVGRQAIVNR